MDTPAPVKKACLPGTSVTHRADAYRRRYGPRSLPGEDGVDGDRVVHRRHAQLVPGQAEVCPVDLGLAVQYYLRLVPGDPRGEGHRTGPVPDGEGPAHGDALGGRRDLLRDERDVRGTGDIEEVRRAQVLIPLLVLGVDRLGGHRDRAGRVPGRRHSAGPGDLTEHA